ncbi:neutral zinc metallopeptidase [Nonomuraea sp. NPDC046570]|uniref:neutral zinc metallopeptidase n=1 Tax=Nonomuraea sp. NPDC046570 TaxID=3155255 RepID=UPI0033EADD0C
MPPRILALLLVLLLAACGVTEESPPAGEVRGDTFDEDVQLAQTHTEDYWRRQFAGLDREYRPVTRFVPYSGADGPACGGQPAVPDNAFYCPAGHFIAYDRGWMEALWNEMGDGSVYVIIPHEIGHAVQAQLGTVFELNVQQELQADCYAGAALGAMVKAGELQAEADDDTELLLNLAAAGDPSDDWFNPQAHGTAGQRQQSFAAGYTNGAGSC